MKKELQQKLFDDFPELFSRRHMTKKESLMSYGINVGDGWYEIIYNLCLTIQNRINSKKVEKEKSDQRLQNEIFELELTAHLPYKDINQIYVEQIKSKFERLCFYLDEYNCDSYILGAIRLAENMSLTVCQECGSFKNHFHNSQCNKNLNNKT